MSENVKASWPLKTRRRHAWYVDTIRSCFFVLPPGVNWPSTVALPSECTQRSRRWEVRPAEGGRSGGVRRRRRGPRAGAVRRGSDRRVPIVTVVEGAEGLDARDELLRQVEVVRLVRRPEAGGEHLDGEVGVELDFLLADVLGEGGLHVGREVHVGHHPLELRGELREGEERGGEVEGAAVVAAAVVVAVAAAAVVVVVAGTGR